MTDIQRPKKAPSKSRGSGLSDVRAYNEKQILLFLRENGDMSKAELARMTGLSAQSLTVIVDSLEKSGLIEKGAKRRGRVGQPSTPYKLRPEGAYSLGLKIGRRSYELLMIDFTGNITRNLRQTCEYPTPQDLLQFFKRGYQGLVSDMVENNAPLVGLGVALPFQIWDWDEVLNAPASEMQKWNGFDIPAELSKLTDLPIKICNDATAACAAELFFGNPDNLKDFLYLYIGTFIGGGIAMNGALYEGRDGNAGAVGSMLIPNPNDTNTPVQLIETASLNLLEHALKEEGISLESLAQSPALWDAHRNIVDEWIDDMAQPLVYAAINTVATMGFKDVIIDGAMPRTIIKKLVETLNQLIESMPTQGLSEFSFAEGTHNVSARALGAAGLPIIQQYSLDKSIIQNPI